MYCGVPGSPCLSNTFPSFGVTKGPPSLPALVTLNSFVQNTSNMPHIQEVPTYCIKYKCYPLIKQSPILPMHLNLLLAVECRNEGHIVTRFRIGFLVYVEILHPCCPDFDARFYSSFQSIFICREVDSCNRYS